MKMITVRQKHEQLKDFLRKELSDNKYRTGDRFPSQNELAGQFNVSPLTARVAMASLVEEGFLTKIQGKGTFVAQVRERIQESHLAALLIPAHGHLYGEFSRHLVRAVQSSGYHALTCDIAEADGVSKRFQRLMSSNMAAFIIDGISDSPFYKLPDCDYEAKPVIFIYRFETPRRFPNAFKVLHDFEAGGYVAIKHLLDLGHRDILLYSHAIQPEPYFLIHSLLKGIYRAFDENGLNAKKRLAIKTFSGKEQANPRGNVAGLKKMLGGPRRPTAVFAFDDYSSKNIFWIARELKISVPDDLAVVGYFNTPWAEMLPVPLTSVSTESERIATEVENILQRIQRKEPIGERTIMVPPKLVIRESSGGKQQGGNGKHEVCCHSRG